MQQLFEDVDTAELAVMDRFARDMTISKAERLELLSGWHDHELPHRGGAGIDKPFGLQSLD
jgi:hypothetical protein